MSQHLERVFVIGMGEVGSRLAGALEATGVAVRPVTRTSGWDEAAGEGPGLRLLCMREEDFPAALEQLRHLPGECLVSVQNGWVRPLLEPFGRVTRGLIWFTSKGEFFKPLRSSPFGGPAAVPLARLLDAGGLPCHAVGDRELDRLDADKMGFNCVVGLPLAVHGLSLGEYLTQQSGEARQVFNEALDACSAAVGVEPLTGAWEGFRESVEPLHWVRSSAAKALEWRNGAVARLGREHGVPTPKNDALLEATGASV